MNPHPIDTPAGARPTASLTNTVRAQIAATASVFSSLSQSFIPREALHRLGEGLFHLRFAIHPPSPVATSPFPVTAPGGTDLSADLSAGALAEAEALAKVEGEGIETRQAVKEDRGFHGCSRIKE